MLIKEARSQQMSNLANADTKRLWQAVSGKQGNGQDNICSNKGTVNQLPARGQGRSPLKLTTV